jgi:hypothetical protein
MTRTCNTLAVGLFVVAVLFANASVTTRAQGNGGATYQTSNAVALATGTPVGGAGTLTRSANNLRARIATSGLDADAAYTVWWIVWNDPTRCSGPCGEDDLGIAGNSVFYAAGFVTGNDGTGNVTADLEAGQLPAGIDVLIPGGLQPGRGLRAEVHLIIRSHGPIVPGAVAMQIGAFDATCAVCEDQQAVVFAPPSS